MDANGRAPHWSARYRAANVAASPASLQPSNAEMSTGLRSLGRSVQITWSMSRSALRLELQGRRVDAVAQAAVTGTVGEHVAEVAAALRAHDLDAVHAVRVVV